jgi:hypothetical protein
MMQGILRQENPDTLLAHSVGLRDVEAFKVETGKTGFRMPELA